VITIRCRTCGTSRELIFGNPSEEAWCNGACYDVFICAVKHLAAGGDPDEIGLEPGSRLVCEAIREVKALRRLEMVERRDLRQREYERNRPRPLKAIYPC